MFSSRPESEAATGKATEAMTKISELHRRWSKDADYKKAYDALGEEFDLARALIKARTARDCRSRSSPGG